MYTIILTITLKTYLDMTNGHQGDKWTTFPGFTHVPSRNCIIKITFYFTSFTDYLYKTRKTFFFNQYYTNVIIVVLVFHFISLCILMYRECAMKGMHNDQYLL